MSFTFPIPYGDSTIEACAHGGFAFWLYGAFGVIAAMLVMRHVPETRGLDAQRVAAFWRAQMPASR